MRVHLKKYYTISSQTFVKIKNQFAKIFVTMQNETFHFDYSYSKAGTVIEYGSITIGHLFSSARRMEVGKSGYS